MNDYLILLISVGILIFAMAKVGMPLSGVIKASKLPIWAKINPADPWGNAWFDSREWLKKILIKIGQGILIFILFFFSFVLAAIKAVAKAFIKAIENSAKSATKKITK